MITSSTYLINYVPVDDIRKFQDDIQAALGADFTYLVGTAEDGQPVPNDVYIYMAQAESDDQVRQVQWSNTQAYLTVNYKAELVTAELTDATWDWFFQVFKFMQRLLHRNGIAINSSFVQFKDQRAINQPDAAEQVKATDYLKQQFPVPTVDNSYTDVSHAFHYTIQKQFQVGIQVTNIRDLYGDPGVGMEVAVDDTMPAQVYGEKYESMSDTAGIVLGMTKALANGGLMNFVESGRLPDSVYDLTASL